MIARSLPRDCQPSKAPADQASDQGDAPGDPNHSGTVALECSTWRPAAVAIIQELSRDADWLQKGEEPASGVLVACLLNELLAIAVHEVSCRVTLLVLPMPQRRGGNCWLLR